LFTGTEAPSSARLELARGLADLAAISLEKSAQFAELTKAYDELRASREVLARTEKLRALGQMAAGVSHDLKNVCSPLSLHLQLVQRALKRQDIGEATESVEEMRAIIARMVEMLERLRGFSRQQPDTRAGAVELNALVHEAIELSKPRMSSRGGPLCKIVEELGAPPPVLARPGDLVPAFVNLVVNSMDAMRDGGTITIRTGELRGGGWVEVRDTGPGMTKEIQERVFEPFFTTKGDEGTGLGLAMVYATVQRYGGTVSLDTAPGKGAAFTIWLPGPRLA
jgi:signal transduction histidine kinase